MSVLLTPREIFKEYREGAEFKSALGTRGMYEQNRINERFYVGDQWYGAKCGLDRPLVRHNIIKRIGEFKMSHITGTPFSVSFSADGIPDTAKQRLRSVRKALSLDPEYRFEGEADYDEINTVVSCLSDYRNITAERVGFTDICGRALKNAYITGSAAVYTYWDDSIKTGLFADGSDEQIGGDIACEVLDIEDVYFADPYLSDVQSQEYILISSFKNTDELIREARAFGADEESLKLIKGDNSGKTELITKLYKEYRSDGSLTVYCTKVTEKAVIRRPFDTGLSLYPIALFRWEERRGLIYGDSEVTYLIPNQIAINRMITASVWAAMTSGMPLMLVNGDTVTGEITNDPGQVIKIYGTNEDVASAVRFVVPPEMSGGFGAGVNMLIENTLTQSGATEAALGQGDSHNASAISMLRNSSVMPLELTKIRFYGFIEQISRIWADFWLTYYGDRRLRIEDENGVWYLPFDSSRYDSLYLTARVDVGADSHYSTAETLKVLGELFDKGIINKKQYVKRLPKGVINDTAGLLSEIGEETDDST